jgi:hypothetical protein
MLDNRNAPETLEGLRKDDSTGHYRVLPGYGHYAIRFRIHETWLDEDDNLWIDGAAVERLWQEAGPTAFDPYPQVTLGHQAA